MANSAYKTHLEGLEKDYQDAEKEIEDFQERSRHRLASLDQEVQLLVAKVAKEKALYREALERKKAYARKKSEEIASFQTLIEEEPVPSISATTPRFEPPIRRSSFLEKPSRASLASLDEPSYSSLDQSERFDIPKSSRRAPTATPQSVQDGLNISSNMKYLPEHMIICKRPDGSWCEIRCFLCGGNYLEKKGWIRGTRGMLAHCNKAHSVDTWEGRRLDATNILDYVSYRIIPESEVVAIMNDKIALEPVPVKDVPPQTNGTTSTTPKGTPKSLKTQRVVPVPVPEVEMEEEEGDRPYDFLKKYPTIVMRKDGTWVELRCDLCSGNSLAVGDKRFAQGVVGFVRHLSKGHGVKPGGNTRGRLDYTMTRCEYREVSAEEIEGLTEESPDVSGPPKIPFKKTVDSRRVSDNIIVPINTPTKMDSPSTTGASAKEKKNFLQEKATPLRESTTSSAVGEETPSSSLLPTKRRFEKKNAFSELEDLSSPSEQSDNSGDEDFAPPRGTTAMEEKVVKKQRTQIKKPLRITSRTFTKEGKKTREEDKGVEDSIKEKASTAGSATVPADVVKGSTSSHSPSSSLPSPSSSPKVSTKAKASEFVPPAEPKSTSTTSKSPTKVLTNEATRSTPISSTSPPRATSLPTDPTPKTAPPPLKPAATEANSPVLSQSTVGSAKKTDTNTQLLENYCPCTMQGHECLNPSCKKTQICSQMHHNPTCKEKYSHATKPTCVMQMLGSECPDGDSCHLGHDHMNVRGVLARHDCRKH